MSDKEVLGRGLFEGVKIQTMDQLPGGAAFGLRTEWGTRYFDADGMEVGYTLQSVALADYSPTESAYNAECGRTVPSLALEDLQAARAEMEAPSEVDLLRRQVATLRMRLDLLESVERVTCSLVREAFEEGAERRSAWEESKAFAALYGPGEE